MSERQADPGATRVAPEPVVRVYLAGPIFGSGRSTANVHRAIHAAERVRRAGMHVFVPHLYTLWDTVSPHDDAEYWLAQDRAWFDCCDVMVRLTGESPGSTREEGWAAACRPWPMPVYWEGDGVGPNGELGPHRGIARLVSDFSMGYLQPRQVSLPVPRGVGADPSGNAPRNPDDDWAAIESFMLALREKLEKNRHKAHWSAVSRDFLLGRLLQEHAELRDAAAVSPGGRLGPTSAWPSPDRERQAFMDECVEVAAFAMMLYDNELERAYDRQKVGT